MPTVRRRDGCDRSRSFACDEIRSTIAGAFSSALAEKLMFCRTTLSPRLGSKPTAASASCSMRFISSGDRGFQADVDFVPACGDQAIVDDDGRGDATDTPRPLFRVAYMAGHRVAG